MSVKPSARIASLDGLPALAITLVLLQHLYSGHTFPILDFLWRFQLGELGVRIFFVISGFLITTLLLQEKTRYAAINLQAFYLRRALRIFPAYYTFLAVVGIGAVLGYQTVNQQEWLASALYLGNYLPVSRVLAHTWSLAVEEQFYLLWPGILVLLGVRKSAWLALLLCIVAPLLRTFGDNPVPQFPTLWLHFEHTGDAIAMGCLYAIWHYALPERSASKVWHTTAIILLPILLFLATLHDYPLFFNAIGSTLSTLLIVVMLHAATCSPNAWSFQWLNYRPVMWLGTLSYSLYLWQQVFVYGGFRLGAPYNLLAIFGAACFSYYLVEKPFLRLKDKWHPPPKIHAT